MFSRLRNNVTNAAFVTFSLVAALSSLNALAQDVPVDGSVQDNKAGGSPNAEPGTVPATVPETPATAGPKEPAGALVESQKGCRIVISGLPPLKSKQTVTLRKNDGTNLSASVASATNGKTIAVLNGPACKQNVKGWHAEAPLDPNSQALQVRAPLVFEPESSGWHRARRPNSYVIGLGAGYQLPGMPLYRLQFGWMSPLLGLVFNYDIGAAASDDLKISGSSSVNWYLFLGNSLFLDVGYGNETRVAAFSPKVVANGEGRTGILATGSSEIGFVHVGFGNKWQWGGFGISVEWAGVRGVVSRTDKVSATEVVTTLLPDGSATLESREITDEASVTLNEDLLRKKVGEGGAYRLMFTTLSYSF